ncbi:hypothetical protein, partial [Xanthomonas campestris]|uniref:hypothetical protein n=1 Tax=Xanthomonas campestris TaxID=339 RepID=UPI001D138F59
RPPSSAININRRPLVLAGIELRGVDIPTSDDGAVDAEPADVDAFQMQEAEGRGDVVVECCGR